MQKYIRAIDQPKSLPKTTIVNCFAKAGLSSENQHQAASDEDGPFKDLVEELTANREVLREHFVKMNGVIEKELVRKRKQMTLDAYFS